MNYFRDFHNEILLILTELQERGEFSLEEGIPQFSAELPRNPDHGDLSTNAALVLAKPAGMIPGALAELIIGGLEKIPDVIRAQSAGPGFINVWFSKDYWRNRLSQILATGLDYGDSDIGRGRLVNVEYVSANPTGPIHVGHGRGAVVGDVLASLLSKVGFNVTKEYYINDAGAQVDLLACSLYLRYCEANGEPIDEFPEGYYPGSYLVGAAEELRKRDGNNWMNVPKQSWLPPLRQFATDSMMSLIRDDLALLGISHDTFTSEKEMVQDGKVTEVIEYLEAKKLVYAGVLEPPKGKRSDDWEQRPQTLFNSKKFGDDVDRPVRKYDGSWTYFASDMSYHLDKFRRGFNEMINVWGADHGGYVKRMKAAVNALTDGKAVLNIKLCQMVNVLEDGNPVKMSKRSGAFVALREVLEKVGKDAFRFIVLTRKNDAPLDFDLVKVMEQSRDNPVYYVQYSHARCHSVIRHAGKIFESTDLNPGSLAKAPLNLLTDQRELSLIRKMASWPKVLEDAAEVYEPHRIAYYLIDLSSAFHSLWTKGAKEDANLRFILKDDKSLTLARLALVRAVSIVIASGLKVMGVKPVEEMH